LSKFLGKKITFSASFVSIVANKSLSDN